MKLINEIIGKLLCFIGKHDMTEMPSNILLASGLYCCKRKRCQYTFYTDGLMSVFYEALKKVSEEPVGIIES
jgi:hypothetical protein